ncbi:hypothetical protein IE53DRAFT_389944 [Violaceomyces palustris]|uniref:Uncharacterized protein n=1 Tax=Violaceomyces palustris TaxID=1673888 RepID=A0ACD0NPX2_9BASI|nr:hypothetical protein IE53DRAFT_389944 [Violaceomyces palustris]
MGSPRRSAAVKSKGQGIRKTHTPARDSSEDVVGPFFAPLLLLSNPCLSRCQTRESVTTRCLISLPLFCFLFLALFFSLPVFPHLPHPSITRS